MCLEACEGGERVLEVGFGTGVTFFNLARKYRQIYGIDLKSDTRKFGDVSAKGLQVVLALGNLLELPYQEDFFDTVLLISILEHLQPEDLQRGFAQIHKVLRRAADEWFMAFRRIVCSPRGFFPAWIQHQQASLF